MSGHRDTAPGTSALGTRWEERVMWAVWVSPARGRTGQRPAVGASGGVWVRQAKSLRV